MKRSLNIITIFLILLFNDSYGQGGIESILRRYKNDQGVFSIKYQGDRLNKVIKSNSEIQTKLDFVDVFIFKNNQNLSNSDIQKLSNTLIKERYEGLLDVKSKEGKVKVSAIMEGDKVSKVLAQLASKELGNCYVFMSGSIKLDELSEIVKNLNMKELNFLKELNL